MNINYFVHMDIVILMYEYCLIYIFKKKNVIHEYLYILLDTSKIHGIPT